MGIIYKLTPKINNYIIKLKKQKPAFSCRKISLLINNKFGLKISKSAVNLIIKKAGLSMPIGRRRKSRRGKIEALGLGAILLKAADYLAGGSQAINDAIADKLRLAGPEILAKTESLIYAPLFSEGASPTELTDNSGLWLLTNSKLSWEEISSYLINLEEVRALYLDIFRILHTIFKEARCIKVSLAEGGSFYLDGQLHTTWSTANIPYDFSTTTYNIKSYINKYFFKEKAPFILFMAPGYDTPTKEFFDFMLSLSGQKPQISRLTLYGDKFEELENIPLEGIQNQSFIFGLWPWQFSACRKVKSLGEFKPYYCEALNKNLYLAHIELTLTQPQLNKDVTLRGAALKSSLAEKIGLVVLSNFTFAAFAPEKLASEYLMRWPNLQEGFQDFSQKVELFTYTASSQRFFSTENLNPDKDAPQKISMLFKQYLKALDLYVKWHFLPHGYEDKDFSAIKEQFYSLKAKISRQKGRILVAFKPPSGYLLSKDLEYVCRRINEREIVLLGGLRLCCQVA